MWLAISTRPDMPNAVRSVVRGWSTPKAIHWKAALGILACIHQWYFWFKHYMSERDISFISLEVFADTDYASKATDRIMRIMCQLEQSYEEVHMCVEFPGRKNVSPSLHLKQSVLLLAAQ